MSSRFEKVLGLMSGDEFEFDDFLSDPDEIYMVANGRLWIRNKSDKEKKWSAFDDLNFYLRIIEHPEKIRLLPKEIDMTEELVAGIKGKIAEGLLWACRHKGAGMVTFSKYMPFLHGDVFLLQIDTFADETYSYSHLYDDILFENSPVYLPDLLEKMGVRD